MLAQPLQYRLEVIGGLSGPELDAFIASGFVEQEGFVLRADGTWHQTQLESDDHRPHNGL